MSHQETDVAKADIHSTDVSEAHQHELDEPSFHEHRGLVRLFVRGFVSLYYPRIEIEGAERIPQTGPVLLCANHGNSLIDPVIIGIAAVRPVRFMAKAPLFDHPILGPPMSALGMVPAFRATDDARQVRRNLESLDIGAKVLVEGRAMGIFPEGKSTDQAHLEMIRSGAARMALQAVEQGAAGVQVVPLGITYERKEQFRSCVLVRIGEPIDVGHVLEQNSGEERKARRQLTSMLQSRLKELVVHLDEPKWEPWLKDLEALVPPAKDASRSPSCRLWQRKRIADAMNYFLEADPPQAQSVADQIKTYRDEVAAAGLRVDSDVLRLSGIGALAKLLWNFAVLVLLFLPALLGTLHHFIPFFLVRKIASRMDQPGRKTVATHRLMVGVPCYLVWYAAVTTLLLFLDARIAWTWLILAPFAGLIAIHYWRHAGETLTLLFHELRALASRTRLKQLRAQLAELRRQLSDLAAAYSAAKTDPPAKSASHS